MRAELVDDLRRLLADTPLPTEDDALLHSFARKVLRPGQIFAAEGDLGGSLAVVTEGIVRATRRVSDDRELTVFMLRRGDVFGFLPLLDGGPYPLSLISESGATLYVLEYRIFHDFLEANPRFCARLLSHVAGRLRQCIDQLGLIGKTGAVPRVAAALLGQLGTNIAAGAIVAWPMLQTDLAQAIGIAPENLSRAISRLQQMRIIHRAGAHRIRIDDPERLRAAAERSLPGIDDRQ